MNRGWQWLLFVLMSLLPIHHATPEPGCCMHYTVYQAEVGEELSSTKCHCTSLAVCVDVLITFPEYRDWTDKQSEYPDCDDCPTGTSYRCISCGKTYCWREYRSALLLPGAPNPCPNGSLVKRGTSCPCRKNVLGSQTWRCTEEHLATCQGGDCPSC